MQLKYCTTALAAAFLLSTLAGCAPSTKRNLPVEFVEGVVTLDGAPLTDAAVQFIPKEEGKGEAAAGYTGSDGKFLLTSMNGDPGKGVLPAAYTVLVEKTVTIQKTGVPTADGDPVPEDSKRVTPDAYADRATSPLEATVVKGKNAFTFDLKSKP